MDILISIKKKYSDRIFSGVKRVEYRKRISRDPFRRVLIYESEGCGGVVGEFEVAGIVEGSPASLWDVTRDEGGVSAEEFDAYFSGRDHGYAIKIGKATRYASPRPLSEYGVKGAPQGFVKLTSESGQNF